MNEFYNGIASKEVVQEIKRVKKQISENAKSGAVSYIFVTDMHIDTTQSKDNYELISDSLKYASFIADTESEIDFIVLGGDCITGWFDKARAKDGISAVVNAVKNCKKPIISAVGNHDNNSNPTTKDNPTEQISKAELKEIMLNPFKDCGYVFDTESEEGLYYYVDLPHKNTRVICLDTYANAEMLCKEGKWLAQKALGVKAENWKYIIILHLPVDERYRADGLPCLSDDMKEILKSFNARAKANCSFGEYDFSDYQSKIIASSFGHCHNSVVEYNPEFGFFVSCTGCAGVVGKGEFKNISHDDEPKVSRFSIDNLQKDRYLFDVLLSSEDSFSRIRFGNGADKNSNKL